MHPVPSPLIPTPVIRDARYPELGVMTHTDQKNIDSTPSNYFKFERIMYNL